jgi:divalent metal cation (Fe/Co/Zn/Cd) transporter
VTPQFGRTELPPELAKVLKKAIRFEWLTIGFLAVTVPLIFLVMGNSQAMKAAWIEDLLSFVPPIAFLTAVRIVNRPPSAHFPYGLHRSIGVAHLVAAVALLSMGTFLLIDSGMGLLAGEHPPIGSVHLFGVTFWSGWLMIGAVSLTVVPPVYLGRVKMALARQLHDKVLYADADMNKADWMTAVGSMVGVAGIGIGLWWADAAAAIFIAGSILWDGIKNLRGAVTDLMDARATTFDDKKPHPLLAEVDDYLRALPWVKDAGSRVRDEGHVFHVESFVVPRDQTVLTLEMIETARAACIELDWKIEDMVIAPVRVLPPEVGNESAPSMQRRA